tara:strand:+ start:157 stop:522 length:366 start_codon:yes stop_codon:yes gene_type:complete
MTVNNNYSQIPDCHHGISQFCGLCEDGKNYIKTCSTCDLKIWAGKYERINHITGNPARQKLRNLISDTRRKYSEQKDIKTYFLKTYPDFKEMFITSQDTKDFLSMYIGNFYSKDLHTILEN